MRMGSRFKRLMHGNSCRNKCKQHHFQLSLIHTKEELRSFFMTKPILFHTCMQGYPCLGMHRKWCVMNVTLVTIVDKVHEEKELNNIDRILRSFSSSTPNIYRRHLSCGYDF